MEIEAPTEYLNKEVWTLRVNEMGQRSIKLTVFEGESADTLYFGGHVKYCIDALIQKPESLFAERIDVSDAFLAHLYYDSTCSLENNFRRGIDSNMILKLCISYIKKNYDHIKTVSFTDTSYITCDDGKVVELPEMSYVRTGKTWYQTHFHAYLDPSDINKFNICEKRFQRAKDTMTWKEMKSYIIGKLPFDESIMKHLFETATTWQEFFGKLSEDMGISQFCSFVAPWLHKFIETEMRFYFSSVRYIIPIEKIEPIEYNMIKYTSGGKQFTRKNRRKFPRNEL